MTAALALARVGGASVLLDNKSTFNDGNRAICISRGNVSKSCWPAVVLPKIANIALPSCRRCQMQYANPAQLLMFC